MAMTKAEQRAAAKRIMEKCGGVESKEEAEMYELLKKRPEEYRPPDPETGERECGYCREKFKDEVRQGKVVSAMQQFTDHLQKEHQASAAQWTEAYEKMKKGSE